jgi:hypothetical protein
MIADLRTYVFPPYFIHADFTLIIADVRELILCGQRFEVTIYANTQLIFLLSP